MSVKAVPEILGFRSFFLRTMLCVGFILVVSNLHVYAQTATLRGFITDFSDGRPIPNVNVVLTDSTDVLFGAATDGDGYYQISQIRPGRYTLRITFIGYETHVDTLLFSGSDIVTLNIDLAVSEQVMDEVVVETEGGAAAVAAGLQTVRPSDLTRIPTPDISGDLASYLQTLPGFITLGDRGGQLFIRGGTSSQNLVLMDGMLVYQPFHIIGFFSAFPEDIVSYADIYAGGFGARYSGRISSAIDISMRSGNKHRFEGKVSAAPFLTSVRIEGPIKKDKISFLVSFRESVVEELAPLISSEPLPFRFGDRFAKIHVELGPNNQLSLLGMQTHDRGTIDPESVSELGNDAVRWKNTVFGARYLILPRNIPLLAELILSSSKVENASGPIDRPDRRSTAHRITSEANMTHYQGNTKVNWGLFARTILLDYAMGGLFQDYEFEKLSLIEVGIYLDTDIAVNDRLQINPSLSLNSFPSIYFTSLEPRIRIHWRPNGEAGRHEFSAAWGIYAQGITGVTDDRDAGSIFTAWLSTPIAQPVSQAMHAILGWQVQARSWLRFGAESYYKRLYNLAVPAWSALAKFTTTLELADGNVYGFDTRMEFQRPYLYGYIGYGFSWVEYQAAQENFGLWFGEPVQSYHPPHDRRHQINAVASLDLGSLTVNLRWQFGSGLPYTKPQGFDEWIPLRNLVDVRRAPGATRLIYEKPYRGRLPTYHRLDLSVDRFFRTRWGTLTVQAGMINVYNRQNLFYFDLFTVRRVDQLPVIPFVGMSMEVN